MTCFSNLLIIKNLNSEHINVSYFNEKGRNYFFTQCKLIRVKLVVVNIPYFTLYLKTNVYLLFDPTFSLAPPLDLNVPMFICSCGSILPSCGVLRKLENVILAP